MNKPPESLDAFYKGIKQEALDTSEVIYNSKEYVVVHSKSKSAAQYWEQSCVTEDEDGNVNAGTCTARIDDSNFFNSYKEDYHIFQIITKEYPTLKETPRTSFSDKNLNYNLVTLAIHNETGFVSFRSGDTVNRKTKMLKGVILYLF